MYDQTLPRAAVGARSRQPPASATVPVRAAALPGGAVSLAAALALLCTISAYAQTGPPLAAGSAARGHFDAQVEALAREKASRTPAERKIASPLLHELKRRQGDPTLGALPALRSGVPAQDAGRVLVDVEAAVSDDLLGAIETLGGTVISSFPRYDAIRAEIPFDALRELADREDVRSVRPAERGMTNKLDTSEGDRAHAADLARRAAGVDGSGVRVGVLSDGVGAIATLQSSGDLPAVTVLPGQAGAPEATEGTAMLEIVHDLAPGAALYFATAFEGQASFAANVLALRDAGCDVIVDDVSYFAAPVFQDGIVAQAVDAVAASGVLYFSSAGNSGNLSDGESGVWEGNYRAAPGDLLGLGYESSHVFQDPDTVGNAILLDSGNPLVLQWSDPFDGAANDYDLFLVDGSANIVAVANDTQDGDDDPLEQLPYQGTDRTGLFLLVLRWAGEDRYLHLNTHRGRLQFGTAGQTAGHSAAAGAFSVAAVDVATANGGVFPGGAANPVETFSSDGPRRMFFTAAGQPYTPGNFLADGGIVRQKPDITAADGVSTATPGFGQFFGTSAAAPHVAALAALMREAGPRVDNAAAHALFAATALDIEAPGPDRDSGYGLVLADALLAALPGVVVADQIGIFRPTRRAFFLDLDDDRTWTSGPDASLAFGGGGDVPLQGADWDGDGLDEVAVYRTATGRFYVDTSGNGAWDASLDRSWGPFGGAGDLPIAGDWDGDGRAGIGVYRPATGSFYLDADGDGRWNAAADVAIHHFGGATDLPVVGDWDADGRDQIGVYRPATGTFFVDLSGDGVWNPAVDLRLVFGGAAALPVAGDWNADGRDEIGVYRPASGTFYLDADGDGLWDPARDAGAPFAGAADLPVVGRWVP